VTDVANPGLIRPPFVYLVAIVLGAGLQLMVPSPFFPQAFNVAVGAALVVIAITLFVSSVGKFRAAGTTVPAN